LFTNSLQTKRELRNIYRNSLIIKSGWQDYLAVILLWWLQQNEGYAFGLPFRFLHSIEQAHLAQKQEKAITLAV
jgi:hypothetical protein